MLSIFIGSLPSGWIKAERLYLFLSAWKRIFPKDTVLSCVCDFAYFFIYFFFIIIFYFLFFFFFCYHNNSWKAQPIWTKFSHMTFDWNSSEKFENGHHRSCVTLPNRGLLTPLKINIPPISTTPNQIFIHDFWLEWLIRVRKWASQVKCNLPPPTPNRGFLLPRIFVC